MGQKVHPYGFRLGFNKPWRSRWFAKQGYATLLREDLELKEGLRNRLKSAGISSIEVDRPGNKLRVTIRTSRPGIIIGRKGAEIEKLKQDLAKRTKREVFIDIQEVHKPELDAQLVSESIALQLEKRVAFRRAMRKAVDSALRFGCKGIKVRVSGRLNGAEIARSEWYLQGQLPLHTLRADIDYGFTEANTTYGVIGIKCWLYKGEILSTSRRTLSTEPEPRRQERRDRGGDRDRDRRGPRGPHGGGGGQHGGGGGQFGGGQFGGGATQAAPPQASQAPAQHEGGATQPPPPEARRGGGAPLMPPLMSPSMSGPTVTLPTQPSWKAEVGKAEVAAEPAATPSVEAPEPTSTAPTSTEPTSTEATSTEPTPTPESTPESGS
jgi:small subunit ribosomal protein S3